MQGTFDPDFGDRMPFAGDFTVGNDPAFKDALGQHVVAPKSFVGIDRDALHVRTPSRSDQALELPSAPCGTSNRAGTCHSLECLLRNKDARHCAGYVWGNKEPLMLIDLDTLVDDVMSAYPATIRAFLDFKMACVGCP